MDMNHYLAETLKTQQRIAVALETIAKNQGTLVQGTTLLAAEPVVGNVPTPAATAAAPAATSPAPAAASPASAPSAGGDAGNASASTSTQASAPAASGGSAPAGDKVKIDDVRAALQAYAKAQGNPAAMKLLEKYEAKSVSGIPADKWADFVKDCA